ncbi:MAG: 16S rRNA (guanine(527)-N(7))-methyltransferase RsmG [Elusimicrobiaceae bacterium]|nr:16S rRNA (guanine(527)-N(7))-methyltransferase RsmG [Elusimicrobiaceae bacterium]
MQQKLHDFAAKQGLSLPQDASEKLALYADLIWQKKDFLNLTSVAGKEEIFTRHLCDGLAGAAFIDGRARQQGKTRYSVADMGSGAGYIGLTMAMALPQAQVHLVESLEKRRSFMNWAILKLGLKNVSVHCMRLGQKEIETFDFVTERAMGQINDILPLLAPCVKQGGLVLPYQSQPNDAKPELVAGLGLTTQTAAEYVLPGEEKVRYLAVFAH